MKKLIFTTIILFIPVLVWADSNWDSMVWDQDSWYSNVTFNDSDSDGLPDNWEISYFGDLSHNGTMDDIGEAQIRLIQTHIHQKPCLGYRCCYLMISLMV